METINNFSRLLTLPAELRTTIYELVLCTLGQGNGNVVTMRLNCLRIRLNEDNIGCGVSRSVLDLLLVCRQIRSEAEGLFYALNHLRYSGMQGAFNFGGQLYQPFIATLGPRRQEALSTITLSGRTARILLQELTCALLPAATNLHTLHVETPWEWKSDDEAVAWAREVQVALMTTNVKVVRIVRYETRRSLASLSHGGSNNNSYVFISERAKLERARELDLKIEGMLRKGIEE